MLKHASRRSQPASRHIDPDRPPAAAGGLTLRSQVPDLRHGPRKLLDCRQLQQAGRRERTRSFDRRCGRGAEGAAATGRRGRGHRLDGSFSYALYITPTGAVSGQSLNQLTSSGWATRA